MLERCPRRDWSRFPRAEGGLLNVGGEVQSGVGGDVLRRRRWRRQPRGRLGRYGRAECRRFVRVRGRVCVLWGQWGGQVVWHFVVAVRVGLSVIIESIVMTR